MNDVLYHLMQLQVDSRVRIDDKERREAVKNLLTAYGVKWIEIETGYNFIHLDD